MNTPAPHPSWVADRQFFWLVTLILVLGFCWPVLPVGLVFYDPVARAAAELGEEDVAHFSLFWGPPILTGMFLLAARFRLLTAFLRDINPGLLALLLWMMLSAIWAPDAFKTFKQAFSIVGVSIIATAFVITAWRPDRLDRVLIPLMTWLLLLSLMAGLLIPDIAIHNSPQFELNGSWRGITYQKNGLGQLSATALIYWFYLWATRKAPPLSCWFGMGLSLLMVLLSRSSTSLLLSIISCGVLMMMIRPPILLGASRGALLSIAGLSILVPLFIYLVLVGSVDSVVIAQSFGEIFGKDATFSGRTTIWAELFRNIAQHPVLGIGFNSFWGGPGSPADETLRRLGWSAPTGHNGYLDLLNELGFIGLGLLAAFMLRHSRDLIRLLQFDRPQAALHTALWVYVVLANLTETGWFHPITMTHVLAMYSSATISRLIFEQRLLRQQRATLSTQASYPA